jgi:sugar-specific transcriptional regulator TrmB
MVDNVSVEVIVNEMENKIKYFLGPLRTEIGLKPFSMNRIYKFLIDNKSNIKECAIDMYESIHDEKKVFHTWIHRVHDSYALRREFEYDCVEFLFKNMKSIWKLLPTVSCYRGRLEIVTVVRFGDYQ